MAAPVRVCPGFWKYHLRSMGSSSPGRPQTGVGARRRSGPRMASPATGGTRRGREAAAGSARLGERSPPSSAVELRNLPLSCLSAQSTARVEPDDGNVGACWQLERHASDQCRARSHCVLPVVEVGAASDRADRGGVDLMIAGDDRRVVVGVVTHCSLRPCELELYRHESGPEGGGEELIGALRRVDDALQRDPYDVAVLVGEIDRASHMGHRGGRARRRRRWRAGRKPPSSRRR